MKELYKVMKRIIPVFEVTTLPASNQPANNDVQVLSNNAGDTQDITLFGVDNNNAFQTHKVTLNGVTAVDSVLNPKWKTIYGAFLGDIYGNISARATGTITIREKSGGQAIATITAGKLSTGIVLFELPGVDIEIENMDGNTWFSPFGSGNVASSTGASGKLTGHMAKSLIVDPDRKYVSFVSDATGSTVQVYVSEV